MKVINHIMILRISILNIFKEKNVKYFNISQIVKTILFNNHVLNIDHILSTDSGVEW